MIPGIVLIMHPSDITIVLSQNDEYTARVWTNTVQYGNDTAMIERNSMLTRTLGTAICSQRLLNNQFVTKIHSNVLQFV